LKGEKVIHEGNVGSCLTWIYHIDFEALKQKTKELLPKFKKIKKFNEIDGMLEEVLQNYNIFCDSEFYKYFIKNILRNALMSCIRQANTDKVDSLFLEDIFWQSLDEIFNEFDFAMKYMTECIKQENLYDVPKYLFALKYYLNRDELPLDLNFKNNLLLNKETRSIKNIKNLLHEDFISGLPEIYDQAEKDNALKSDAYDDYDEIYHIADMYELADISMKKVLEAEYRFKICEVCKKPFILYFRSDTKYCDRMSPNDRKRTCKEYGAKQAWYNGVNASDTKRLYRNVYQAKQMLVKRNPDIVSYKEDFERFKQQANAWIKDVKDGVKSEDDYFNWLLDMRRKRFDERWKRK